MLQDLKYNGIVFKRSDYQSDDQMCAALAAAHIDWNNVITHVDGSALEDNEIDLIASLMVNV